MKQTTDITHDLITGDIEVLTKGEQFTMDFYTTIFKGFFGDCDNACVWANPYGWSPECGCPIHDKDG